MATQNLTKIGSSLQLTSGTDNIFSSIWIVPAPVAGAGTLTITSSSSVTINYYAQLWSGMSQVSSADSVGTSQTVNNSASDLIASTTTVANNSMSFFNLVGTRNDDTPGSGTKINGSTLPSNTFNNPGTIRLWSGTAVKTPAGSVSLTASNASARKIIGQVFSLAPNGTPTYNSEYPCSTIPTTTSFADAQTLATATNGMLIVQVGCGNTSDTITGVTWTTVSVNAGAAFFMLM